MERTPTVYKSSLPLTRLLTRGSDLKLEEPFPAAGGPWDDRATTSMPRHVPDADGYCPCVHLGPGLRVTPSWNVAEAWRVGRGSAWQVEPEELGQGSAGKLGRNTVKSDCPS